MRPIRSALNRIHHPAILAAGWSSQWRIPVEMGVYSSQNLLSWSTIRISLLVAVLCAMLGAAPVWAACLLFAVSGYALLWLFSPLTTIMIAALTSIAVLSFVKPRLGAASALAALAALAANNMQNNLTSSNIVGMIIMCYAHVAGVQSQPAVRPTAGRPRHSGNDSTANTRRVTCTIPSATTSLHDPAHRPGKPQ